MATINEYSFGKIVIDGKEYNSDVIVYPDRVQQNWWRKEGHNLYPEDIEEVLQSKPDVVIIGCGDSGVMKVPSATRKIIEAKGVKLIVVSTDEAIKKYNELSKERFVIACLHLTC